MTNEGFSSLNCCYQHANKQEREIPWGNLRRDIKSKNNLDCWHSKINCSCNTHQHYYICRKFRDKKNCL